MSLGLLLLEVFVFILVFLITLNEHFLGAAKEKIRTALFLLNIISVVVVFVAYGWIAGIITIPLLLVFAIVSTPLAKFVAFKVLGFRATDAMLSRRILFNDFLEQSENKREKDKACSVNVLASQDIKNILSEYGETQEELEKWADVLSWEVVSSPKKLRMLLELKKQGVPDVVIVNRLRQM